MSSGVMARYESTVWFNSQPGTQEKRAAEAARLRRRRENVYEAEALAAGAMSPFAVQVMLKPLRLVQEYLGLPSAPLK